MTGTTLAHAGLNNLLPSMQQVSVSPSEEPVFIITANQLENIISSALQPLRDEVQDLKAIVARQQEEIAALKATRPGITALRVDDCFTAIEEIDEHLLRIDRTRTTAPPQGSKTIARIATLETVLKARGGGMTFKEAGAKLLKIKRNQMTKLVSQLDKRCFEIMFARAREQKGEDNQAEIVARGVSVINFEVIR